jgi:hypothetical protein
MVAIMTRKKKGNSNNPGNPTQVKKIAIVGL